MTEKLAPGAPPSADFIPLIVPEIRGNEWKYVKDCLDTNWVSSVGSYVDRFERTTAERAGTKFAVATVNGTAALHIALLLAGVQPEDEVLVSTLTFIAPANAIRYVGAWPVFIDAEPKYLQMDPARAAEFLEQDCRWDGTELRNRHTGRRIKAILPVHILGHPVDLDPIMELASRYSLQVIEDATEGLGARYKGRNLGSVGHVGCFSFNGNKIITTGGGGMIITNDEQLAKKAKHLTTQAKADPNEYYHDEVGYNYRLVNVLAAMGVAQMEQLPGFIKRKKEIASFYNKELGKIPGFSPQKISPEVDSNNWLYTAKVKQQPALRKFLRDNQVDARPFWVPMNQLPANKDSIYFNKTNTSQEVYQECLSLPCSTHITDDDLSKVASLVRKFYHD